MGCLSESGPDRFSVRVGRSLILVGIMTSLVTYIALLRGINVAGKNPVKMGVLKEIFEGVGFQNVRTYVQSGNVVFRAAEASPTDTSKILESALKKKLGLTITVVVRTSVQMEMVLKGNPFLGGTKPKAIDESKLHVTFLSDTPHSAGLHKLKSITSSPDQFLSSGEEIYLYCPNGYGRTKLSNNVIEKALESGATTRNWRTVNQLFEMSQE
jgi:uncharacterized protein (DUF1697 family)